MARTPTPVVRAISSRAMAAKGPSDRAREAARAAPPPRAAPITSASRGGAGSSGS